MQTFLLVYLVAATLVSLAVLFAGWRRSRARSNAAAHFTHDPDGGPDDKTPADVHDAAVTALNRLLPLLARQASEVDLGIRPGLLVRLSEDTLAGLLEDLLTAMLQNAPASPLLLTAVTRGGQIAVVLSDETADSDEAELRGMFRGLAERVALRGGALDVAAEAGQGTTVTLRLAAAQPGGSRPPGKDVAAPAVTTPSTAALAS